MADISVAIKAQRYRIGQVIGTAVGDWADVMDFEAYALKAPTQAAPSASGNKSVFLGGPAKRHESRLR